jgi:glycosyltransferase involved in cell wall biosynthesis
MNITFLAPCKDLSGGIKVIATYGNKLVERGHDVTVVYPRRPIDSLNALKQRTLKILKREQDHLDRFKGKLLAVDSVNENSVPTGDILIATAWETAEWAGRLSAAKGRKFYLIQGHEVWNSPKERVYETLKMPFTKITISSWLKDLVAEISGDREIALLPNGSDFRFAEAEVLNSERHYDVGLVYSAIPNKDSASGLKAMRMLLNRNPDLRFVIFGTSEPEQLPPNTTFYLKPAPHKIAEIYRSTRVWLSTSYEEGFCLPCLEAMSAGAIPVSTDNKGVRDIIEEGHSGFITEPGDPDSLVTRSETLLNNGIREHSMRQESWLRSRRFSWERSADQLETMFNTPLQEAA